MDEFGCDYMCRTVCEGIVKYGIPDDWCAEFVAEDCCEPVVCIQVEQVRKNPALMQQKLRIIEDPEKELAACIVLVKQKIIAFKIDYISDLVRAIPESPGDCHASVRTGSQ